MSGVLKNELRNKKLLSISIILLTILIGSIIIISFQTEVALARVYQKENKIDYEKKTIVSVSNCRGTDTRIETTNEDANRLLTQGSKLSDIGKYEESIKYYDQALEEDPNLAAASYNKGIILSKLGKYEEAIESYNQALGEDPNHAAAFQNKGNALSQLGKYEEAIESYDQALKVDPNYATAFHNKGNTLSLLGKYEEAIESYNQALEVDPNCDLASKAKSNVQEDLEDTKYTLKSTYSSPDAFAGANQTYSGESSTEIGDPDHQGKTEINSHKSTVTVYDSSGNIKRQFSLDSNSNNNPPIANDASITTNMNQPVDIQLLASDKDNDELTASIVSAPSNGVLSDINQENGMVTYTPNSGFSNNDTFTFQVNDGKADSIAQITVAVNQENNPPSAHDTTVTTNVNKPIDITLPASDPDQSDELTASIVSAPSSGTLSDINQNTGIVTYTPNTRFANSDSFMFKVNDGKADSNSGLIQIAINQEEQEQQQIPVSPITNPSISVADELSKLVTLFVQGVITKEEFTILKTTTITTVTGGTSITSEVKPPLGQDNNILKNNVIESCNCLPKPSNIEPPVAIALTEEMKNFFKNFPHKPEFHHIFPQHGRTLFQIFKINIDDYLVPLASTQHHLLHDTFDWNPKWGNFMTDLYDQYLSKKISLADAQNRIYDFAAELMGKAGIDDFAIFTKQEAEQIKAARDYLRSIGEKGAAEVLTCIKLPVNIISKYFTYLSVKEFVEDIKKGNYIGAIGSGSSVGSDVLTYLQVAFPKIVTTGAATWLAYLSILIEAHEAYWDYVGEVNEGSNFRFWIPKMGGMAGTEGEAGMLLAVYLNPDAWWAKEYMKMPEEKVSEPNSCVSKPNDNSEVLQEDTPDTPTSGDKPQIGTNKKDKVPPSANCNIMSHPSCKNPLEQPKPVFQNQQDPNHESMINLESLQQNQPFSITGELGKLVNLRQQGIISEVEFNQLKQNAIQSNIIDNEYLMTNNGGSSSSSNNSGNGGITETISDIYSGNEDSLQTQQFTYSNSNNNDNQQDNTLLSADNSPSDSTGRDSSGTDSYSSTSNSNIDDKEQQQREENVQQIGNQTGNSLSDVGNAIGNLFN
jgi:tetratricopeptide (TPR) repeat protein